MLNNFNKLFMSEEEVKRQIIQDFTYAYLKEINNLVEKLGKTQLLELSGNKLDQ